MQYIVLLKWKISKGNKVTAHSSRTVYVDTLWDAVKGFETDTTNDEEVFLLSAEIVGVNDGLGTNFGAKE